MEADECEKVQCGPLLGTPNHPPQRSSRSGTLQLPCLIYSIFRKLLSVLKVGQSKQTFEPAAAQQAGVRLRVSWDSLELVEAEVPKSAPRLPESSCSHPTQIACVFLSLCGWMGVGVRIRLFVNQLSNQLFINKLSKLEVQPRCGEPGQEWVSKELCSSPAQP